ncbi:MAG: hypothetical protein MJA32_09965 [Proteobacteria bacterium]|nr:hypothetical protein [Pseudomonadota bacterium]
MSKMRLLKQLRLPIAAGIVLFVCAAPDATRAQQWEFEPIVRVGGEYDDNATLSIRTDDEVELTGLLADLRAVARYSSATTTFDVQPRVVLREYDADRDVAQDFDAEDVFLRSTLRHRGRSITAGFRAFYDRQKVRTAERAISDLDIDDPDDVTEDDTARVVLSGTRDKIRLVPYLSYDLSAVTTIGADFVFSDVQYDDVIAGSLSDYTDTRLNLNFRRKMSDRTASLLTVTGRTFSPEGGAAADINGYGIQAGFERELSATTRVTALAGIEDADGSDSSQSPEFVSTVTLQRNLETIAMFARYRRSINASGAGALSVRDTLNLNFRRRLSEKVSAGLGVRTYRQRGKEDAQNVNDRDYIQLQSNVQWYLAPSLVAEMSYRYTVSDRSEAIGERSNSNQVNLWFIYQPRTTPKL